MASFKKDGRAYTAGKFGLELDGIMAGWVQSVDGGQATSDVVSEKIGPDHIIHKHIAGVKYEDITVNCGTGMSKGFYDWIEASFKHNYQRKNGAVLTADFDFTEHTRLSFFNALISEIGFPALDASSKDAAKMTIKLTPEYTRMVAKPGSKISGGAFAQDAAKQKRWLPSNFKLQIPGLDCTRVNKIEAITVKQKVVDNPVGELRDYEKEPAHLEIPNLVVTLAESHAKEFYDWHENFVVKGNNGQDAEKTAQLDFLTPDLKTVLFTIEFMNVGIFKMTHEKVESGSEQIRRCKAEMYVEDLKLSFKNSTWA